MQHMHQLITNDMIHFISSCDRIGSSILTSLVLHHCFGPSASSHHSTCPSHLQLVHQAKSCLDLLHLSHMTQYHLIWNELLHHMYKPCNKSKPSSLSWHELLTQVYLWTNHLCISHLNTLVHLGFHSITKTNKDLSQRGRYKRIDGSLSAKPIEQQGGLVNTPSVPKRMQF
jgi:hypothetical protein